MTDITDFARALKRVPTEEIHMWAADPDATPEMIEAYGEELAERQIEEANNLLATAAAGELKAFSLANYPHGATW